MPTATDFSRDDCQLGTRRISYAKLRREYCCSACGGRIVEKWNEATNYYLECGRCGEQNFTHEMNLLQQKSDAIEVFDGLPPALAAIAMKGE